MSMFFPRTDGVPLIEALCGPSAADPSAQAAYEAHRPALVALLDPARYSGPWLDAQVWTGTFKVFGNDRGCILVSVESFPSGVREIHGQAAVGELDAIKVLIDEACAWGRSIGARAATIASREGWARALRDDGWVTHQVEVRKSLF